MKRELKAQWLEALRSGRYKQGKYRLRNSRDEFCCLGVLCDISGEGEWEHSSSIGYLYKRGEEQDKNVLPTFLHQLVDMEDGQEDKLIDMSDGDGLSFLAIANWIEENIAEE